MTPLQVTFHLTGLQKGQGADGAVVRSLAFVQAHVYRELAFVCKALGA